MFVKRNPIREATAGKNTSPSSPTVNGITESETLVSPFLFYSSRFSSNSSLLFVLLLLVAVAHIRLGSYYEIDSSILPQRSPEQLKSIRIVMVLTDSLLFSHR